MLYQRKEECTGCGGCIKHCPKQIIEIEQDQYGFFYPKIKQKECVQCSVCEKKCPNKKEPEERIEQQIIGCKIKEEAIRQTSTSGGIFTAIAREIIKNSGIVYGAILGQNFEVYHTGIEKEEELRKLSGAKYVQSNLKNTFSEIKQCLKENRKVLFSGTPCQVAGLKAYLGKEEENLLTVDLVCHGVPSPLLWKKYIEYLQKQGKLQNFYFRNKKTRMAHKHHLLSNRWKNILSKYAGKSIYQYVF